MQLNENYKDLWKTEIKDVYESKSNHCRLNQ